jgi:fimbrial chaperone protein
MHTRRTLWTRCAAWSLVLWGGISLGHAAGLSVSPLRLDFDGARNISALTITNTSRDTVTFEVDTIPWPDNAPGQSARDIVVNPPISTLPPGARKTVRVGLVKRLGGEQERSYRIYITELASPRSAESTGIGVRLRLGIPAFVQADSPREQALQWSVQREDKALELTATNPGNVHQRIASLSVERGDKQYTAAQKSSYILAGRSTAFRLEDFATQPGEQLMLRIQTGDKPVRVPVQVP